MFSPSKRNYGFPMKIPLMYLRELQNQHYLRSDQLFTLEFNSSYYTWWYQGISLADCPPYRLRVISELKFSFSAVVVKSIKIEFRDMLNTLQCATPITQVSPSLPHKIHLLLDIFSIYKSPPLPLLYISFSTLQIH